MGRGKAAKRAKKEEAGGGAAPPPPEWAAPADPPRAVVAVHAGAGAGALAVAVGPELRVWDARCAPWARPPPAPARQRRGRGGRVAPGWPRGRMRWHMLPPPGRRQPPLARSPRCWPPTPLGPWRRSGQLRTLVTAADTPALGGDGKPLPPAVVRGLAFDASGRRLLAGSEDKGAGLRIWDTATWELLQSMCAARCRSAGAGGGPACRLHLPSLWLQATSRPCP